MKDTVRLGVEQIRDAFPSTTVDAQEDGDGGAWVLLAEANIGELYNVADSWLGFRISFQYPHADVYPHFIRADLVRKDGRPLGDGISGGHQFMGRPALQLSRRSNRLNPATDTALLKLLKVIQWLKTRP